MFSRKLENIHINTNSKNEEIKEGKWIQAN